MKKLIFLLGFFYMALWNRFFCYFPSYFLRKWVLRLFYKMQIGDSAIHSRVNVWSPWKIKVGDGSNVQMDVFLDGRGGIVIGDNADICPDVTVLTAQHDIQDKEYPIVKRPVVIEKNAVVGTGAMVLPGVTIHEGGVVAAGSVVTKDVAPYTMVAGNPAIYKKDRNKEINYRVLFKRPFH